MLQDVLHTCLLSCVVSQEVRRAGEHTATVDALQLLLWELHGGLLAALQQLMHATSTTSNGNMMPAGGPGGIGSRHQHANSSSSSRALSEKGVLQLLFDQRFLRDVLTGGKPLAVVSGGVGGSSGVHAATANGNGGSSSSGSGVSAEAAVAARKQLVTAVEQQLQVGLLVAHLGGSCRCGREAYIALTLSCPVTQVKCTVPRGELCT